MAKSVAGEGTIDPTQVRSPSQIPPPGSRHAGVSPQGLADIYYGAVAGDVDAQPSAKELLGESPDTGGLSNADYIYDRVSALYGGAQLPVFQSPSGNSVRSVVFVSGSSQGGYGAFHIDGTQADIDRLVVDSLTASGSYSAGSGLPARMVPVTARLPYLFPLYRGAGGLLAADRLDDPKLEQARADVHGALIISARCVVALGTGFEAKDGSAVPTEASTDAAESLPLRRDLPEPVRLVHANLASLGLTGEVQAAGSRRYLSTALFAAEIVESFEKLTGKGDPGRTDGEAVSRVVSFKLAPEIALVPGFDGAVAQKWWQDGHPDFVNVNSESDQSVDGNGAGVMFLEFLTDYLGLAMDVILGQMPASRGAPLGETYTRLVGDLPPLAKVAGADGPAAFQKMVSLLQQNAQNPDGSLNLPADGNPFPGMPGSKQGGLFSGQPSQTSTLAAIGLQARLVHQSAALESVLRPVRARRVRAPSGGAAFAYGPPLTSPLVETLAMRAAPFRAPQYDQILQKEFWPHVYNELPGTGPYTDRLQVITGDDQAPLAVQATGTIIRTQLEPDGDLHVYFQPDSPGFPVNQGPGGSPLDLEIIYAGPVTQADAKQAEVGFKNPFDISRLTPGVRIMAAGPLIFDRAHGVPTPDGSDVETGLEVHPVAGMAVLKAGAGQPSALGQLEAIGQTLASLKSVLQEKADEAP